MALRPYDPVGAMGGLFAPALIRGNRESELAFDEWMARNLKRPPAPDAPPAPPAPTMEGAPPESEEEAAARQRDAIARTIMMLQGGDQGGGGVDTTAPLDPSLDPNPHTGSPSLSASPTPPPIDPPETNLGPPPGTTQPSAPVVSAPQESVPTPQVDPRGGERDTIIGTNPVTGQPIHAQPQELQIEQTNPQVTNVTPVQRGFTVEQDQMTENTPGGKGPPAGFVPSAMPTAQEMQFGTQMQLALDPSLGGKIGAPQSQVQSERDVAAQYGLGPPSAVAPVAAPEAPAAPGVQGSGKGLSPDTMAAAVAAATLGIGSPLAGPAQSYGGFGPASSGPAAATQAGNSNAFGLAGLTSGTPGVSSTGHVGTTGMGLLSGTAANSGQTTPAPDPGMFGMAFGTAPPGSPSGGFTVGQAPSGSVFGDNPYGGMPSGGQDLSPYGGEGNFGGIGEGLGIGGFGMGMGNDGMGYGGGGLGGYGGEGGFGPAADAAAAAAVGGYGTGYEGGTIGGFGPSDSGSQTGGGYGGGGLGGYGGGGFGDAPGGPSGIDTSAAAVDAAVDALGGGNDLGGMSGWG